MILFVDASAIVAMLGKEADQDVFIDRIGASTGLLWSPVVRWEAIATIARHPGIVAERARSIVLAFGREWDFTLVPVGKPEDEIAFDAYRRYGRSTGHPARLNMGDCFAYACAKTNEALLLYKGDDFSETDMA